MVSLNNRIDSLVTVILLLYSICFISYVSFGCDYQFLSWECYHYQCGIAQLTDDKPLNAIVAYVHAKLLVTATGTGRWMCVLHSTCQWLQKF